MASGPSRLNHGASVLLLVSPGIVIVLCAEILSCVAGSFPR
jgi:hypothetical protein